jgi:hypothetical protein
MEMPVVSPRTMEFLLSQEIIDIAPRLLPSDTSDDSSLNKSLDSNTSAEDNDEDTKIEDILNSSDTNALLDTLKIKIYNDNSDSDVSEEYILGETPTGTSNVLDEQDEFPLFNNHNILNTSVIENEFRVSTPEKCAEEYTISERTRSSAKSPQMIPRNELPNLKSRIPLPTGHTSAAHTIRRSKRLIESTISESTYNQCSPKKIKLQVKPAIKESISTLNFIVNSSSGELTEATKYATEINAANSEGILIPKTPYELVSIPVKGARRSTKQNKMALVSAYKYTRDIVEHAGKFAKLGFYTEEQHKRYFNSGESPAKMVKSANTTKAEISSPKIVKKLRWANELEW